MSESGPPLAGVIWSTKPGDKGRAVLAGLLFDKFRKWPLSFLQTAGSQAVWKGTRLIDEIGDCGKTDGRAEAVRRPCVDPAGS
jgi:hypothetical protein